jgi:hypothetical protein
MIENAYIPRAKKKKQNTTQNDPRQQMNIIT